MNTILKINAYFIQLRLFIDICNVFCLLDSIYWFIRLGYVGAIFALFLLIMYPVVEYFRFSPNTFQDHHCGTLRVDAASPIDLLALMSRIFVAISLANFLNLLIEISCALTKY